VNKRKEQEKHFVNERIRSERVQVIGDSGENHGEMTRKSAIDLAKETGLDLVMVGQKGDIAVTKIMDFGKFLYLKKKKEVQSKKSHKVIQIKEIKMRPKIGPGDYTTKMSRAIRFLEEGKHVKFSLQFRGRQPISIREVGESFFNRIKGDLDAKNLGTLTEEKESRSGFMWSKVFYIKNK
jgi:translation initiation factor IF-3